MAEETPPDFIHVTADQIVKDFTSDYEGRAGKIVQPAQPETLLINSISYELFLNALRIQYAAEQNLAQFATGSTLDLRVADAGVTRIPAIAAKATLLLTLVPGHGNLTIPSGLRVQSVDGLATFVLPRDLTVAALADTYSVEFECDTAGIIGNGYIAGKINVILDPKPYLQSASNTNTSAGGSEIESDAALRARYFLAPNAYSNAGSRGAYEFFAKSASPLILDVTVKTITDDYVQLSEDIADAVRAYLIAHGNLTSVEDVILPLLQATGPGGGIIEIYPLVAGGTTPDQILDLVYAAASAEDVRPLSDTVRVYSPTVVNYTIDMSIIRYQSADASDTIDAVTAALQAFTDANSTKLGLDIVMNQLIGIAQAIPGVYKATLTTPSSDTSLNSTQVSICTDIDVAVTGVNNDK